MNEPPLNVSVVDAVNAPKVACTLVDPCAAGRPLSWPGVSTTATLVLLDCQLATLPMSWLLPSEFVAIARRRWTLFRGMVALAGNRFSAVIVVTVNTPGLTSTLLVCSTRLPVVDPLGTVVTIWVALQLVGVA